ncbi:GFA family protein [Oxalobacteraceae bacterium OM1]|nr:GFA family protein [Oxalobacteraceae bacterium OM1]
MIRTTCHCGAVSIAIPRAPEAVTNCNCSICRRYGALWAYFNSTEVDIQAAPGVTDEYAWGEKSLAFVRCSHCGCVTHWRPLEGRTSPRMGVNVRNFEPEQIGPVRIRLLDGAVTEQYVGELGVGQSDA